MKDKKPKRTSVSRRAFMAGFSAVGAGALRCTPERPYVPSCSFPIGVSSGDATHNAVKVLTRYRGEAITLQVAVSAGEAPVPESAPRFPVQLDEGGFASHLLEGLAPATWHRFVFESVGPDGSVIEQSPMGRFRTAFSEDTVAPLTLGAVCCTKYDQSFATLGQAARRTDLDAFILLGDVCYADGAKTRSEFREYWGRTLDTPEYRALRASTSVVALWDDHEVRNNWDRATLDSGLFETALATFLEHQPIRMLPEAPERLWRSLRWGRTVELFALDSRSERDRSVCQYLSDAQLDWLIKGVTQSPAAFKLILNTVPIGSFDAAFFVPFEEDMWLACPDQRRKVLEAIDQSGVRGVVWVSGDFHLACVGRVSHPGHPGDTQLEVLVGPGAQRANMLPSYPGPPQFDWSSGTNNYTELHLEPTTGELTLRYFNGEGRIFFERTYTP